MMNPLSARNMLGGIQWLLFMFANTVVIPISVGSAFHLPPEELAASLQRSFVLTGLACAMQALWGHKYSLMEGQSGLWWALVLSLCSSASSLGLSLPEIGGSLAVGIILSGIVVTVLGSLGFDSILKRLFNPMVMTVYLFLLSYQLIGVFVKGMIGYTAEGAIDLPKTGLSAVVVVLVMTISLRGKSFSNYALLIGMVAGWAAYALIFPPAAAASGSLHGLFQAFSWGAPSLHIGIVVSSLIAGLLNSSNTITTLRGAEDLYPAQTKGNAYRRSFVITGLFSVVSGLFSMVPYAPYTSSLGFLQTTRILERTPFVVGSALFMVIGLVPAWGGFFSTIPVSVGDAVLFVAYLQLFGSAIRSAQAIHMNSEAVFRIAAPALLGMVLMSLGPNAFVSFPELIRPLAANGLLVGLMLSLLAENLIPWSKVKTTTTRTGSEKPGTNSY